MKIKRFNCLALLLVLFLLVSSFAYSIPPRQLYLQSETGIWLGTPEGLKKYQAENELWTTVLGASVTDQCFDDDVLWVGTPKGLFYADLRYLDWKRYGAEDGLPGDSIVRIAADLDFIYVVSSEGLARFDKLVQQWESLGDFSGSKIYDLYSDQEFLWVATDAGIHYFEKQYEKWKRYDSNNGLPSDQIYRLFYFNDYLWALTDKGLSRYNAKMKTWNSFNVNSDIPGSAINNLYTDAEYIWLITPERVIRYSGKKQTWEDFSKNTPIEKLSVVSLSTSGKNSWFATSDGVYFFEEKERRWMTYTAIEGLSDDVQNDIYCIGQTVIAKKDNTYSVYFPAEDLWHAKEVAAGEGLGSGDKKWDFYNDEKGLGVSTPSGRSASLLGRAYFKLKNKAEFPDPMWQSIGDYITNTNLDSIVYDSNNVAIDTISRFKDYLNWWPKAQLNLNVDLKNGRTLRGSYANIDPLGSVPYGLEYRGYGDDVVKKMGWLYDQKTDYFNSTLIDQTYIEGAGLRAEMGSRVGEKKRRRVNTGAWAGWRKTEYIRKLIPFDESNFYSLNVKNIITESVEIKVDGKVIDPREYSLERTKGLLSFKNEGLVTPDSQIEISLEYEPKIGGHTNEMAAVENVVVFSDGLSVGANGAFRQFDEPDQVGTGIDKNRLAVGSVNGKIDLKSENGEITFKSTPELSTSYNDSIVAGKKGTAAKVDVNTSIYDLRMKGQLQLFSKDYETLADLHSIYGRMKNQSEFEATYDIKEYMPVTAGFSHVNAAFGKESKQYFEYLFSPSGKPSLKLQGLHQKVVSEKQSHPKLHRDSITSNRYNGRVEMEWNLSKKALDMLHIERLWMNASYSADGRSDFLFDSLDQERTQVKRVNQNFFGRLQILPFKSLSLETRQIYRTFRQEDTLSLDMRRRGFRYLPEIWLFSQELIPGVTMIGNLAMERAKDSPDTSSTEEKSKSRLNSNLLLIPGVWWSVLNPFQLNLVYSFSAEDSTYSFLDTSNTQNLATIKNGFGHTFIINPMLDFTQNARVSSRIELSRQKNFDVLQQKGVEIFNESELYFRDRKTKLLLKYDIASTEDYMLNLDSIPVFDTMQVNLGKHDVKIKWTERWKPLFRTELHANMNWLKTDTLTDSIQQENDYKHTLAPGVLVDWRVQKEILKEFRLQYFTGLSWYDGQFFNFPTYKTSWDNKLDMSVKVGRSFIFRLLVNLNYLIDEKLLKYDLTELKATALF